MWIKKNLGVKAIGDRNSTYLKDPPVQKMKVLAQFYDPRPPVPVFLRSSRSLTPSPFLSDYYDKVKLPAMDFCNFYITQGNNFSKECFP